MAYQHGIYIEEVSDVNQEPVKITSGLQVVVGTAPINLLDNPKDAVNKPLLVSSLSEAKSAVGYCEDFDKYTLCQAVDASFNVFGVSPIVLINVLDPDIHSIAGNTSVDVSNGKGTIKVFGILIDENFVVNDSEGQKTYVKDTDYSVSFDNNGYITINILSGSIIPSDVQGLQVSYKVLDPSKVSDDDIIGEYTAATNTYKGIECIAQVYPKFNIVPGLLLAPGWSHKKDVEKALKAKNTAISGCFNCTILSDIDTSAVKVYSAAKEWKVLNDYTDKREIVLWPKIKIGTKIYYYSAILAALINYTDSQNNDVPFKSPSNKKISISATVLEDGSEVFLDQLQANELNGAGIVTAINMSGWRVWGNNTAAYPDDTEAKSRFIPIRRLFDWWGNNFIVDFYDKVDDPTNYRLIESVVDDENIKANGFQAAGQIAGAKITFSQANNPINSILSGKIVFTQSLGAFPPAENIVNILSFDPNSVQSALTGGEN